MDFWGSMVQQDPPFLTLLIHVDLYGLQSNLELNNEDLLL